MEERAVLIGQVRACLQTLNRVKLVLLEYLLNTSESVDCGGR